MLVAAVAALQSCVARCKPTCLDGKDSITVGSCVMPSDHRDPTIHRLTEKGRRT